MEQIASKIQKLSERVANLFRVEPRGMVGTLTLRIGAKASLTSIAVQWSQDVWLPWAVQCFLQEESF